MTAPAVDFTDIQGLARFGHGRLRDAEFLLAEVADPSAARTWLAAAPVTTAEARENRPETALQVALTAPGLRALGLDAAVLAQFPQAFLAGMAGEASRSRRLGDVGANAPENWHWGVPEPHLLLMLYAETGGLEAFRATLLGPAFDAGFRLVRQLPTATARGVEPFGFADGISEPVIDWDRTFTTELHHRLGYANLLATGELLLGHPNEYGEVASRPLTRPADPSLPTVDLGMNGSFLVLRQLHQDVRGFWGHLDAAAGGDPGRREALAAAMVGRRRDGTALIADGPAIPGGKAGNDFTYGGDIDGHACPVGAHVRRANPRTGDHPPGVTGLWSWFLSTLGFRRRRDGLAGRHDLVASGRFHRLIRRGREYGPTLAPDEALQPGPDAERGILFVALCADLVRQFEFVQEAWLYAPAFDGLHGERDPLTAVRTPLPDGTVTDRYTIPNWTGVPDRLAGLPQFVTVRGGAYFFLPGLRALRHIAGG